MKVTRKYQLTPDALRHLEYFDVYAHRIIVESLRVQLVENDPEEETRHKGRLREPVAETTHKIEIEKWRAYYRVDRHGHEVVSTVHIIGEKRGNKLIVEGDEFQT